MSTRAFVVMIVVSAITGVGGAFGILFFQNGVGGIAAFPLFYAIPSVLTWALLTPYILNRSVGRAIVFGLLSPALACAMFLPLFFLGLYWAVALLRCWWLTLPIAVGTSLLIQLLASDYTAAYRRGPRVAALLLLLVTMGTVSAVVIRHNLNDPLRESAAVIRARLLEETPSGSSPKDVLHALESTIEYEQEMTRSYYGKAKYDPQRQGRRYEETPDNMRMGYPVGKGSIEATLGSYRTRAGIVRVQATWAFDADERLLDVFVNKNWLYHRDSQRMQVRDPE
jgi:hypothetical protein